MSAMDPQIDRLAEARKLLQMLSDSREFRLYIGADSRYGKRVAAWLAGASPSWPELPVDETFIETHHIEYDVEGHPWASEEGNCPLLGKTEQTR